MASAEQIESGDLAHRNNLISGMLLAGLHAEIAEISNVMSLRGFYTVRTDTGSDSSMGCLSTAMILFLR